MQTSPEITSSAPPAIAEAAEVHDAAVQRYFEAIEAHHQAVAALDAAQKKQDQAVKAASATGAALPAATALQKAQQAVADAKVRQRECRDVAVGKGRSLTRTVAEHASEWREQLVEQQQAADDRLEAATTEYLDAIEAAADVRGVEVWIGRCQQSTASVTSTQDLPATVPAEVVLGPHDPRSIIERFAAWLGRGGREAPHVRQMRPDAA